MLNISVALYFFWTAFAENKILEAFKNSAATSFYFISNKNPATFNWFPGYMV